MKVRLVTGGQQLTKAHMERQLPVCAYSAANSTLTDAVNLM